MQPFFSKTGIAALREWCRQRLLFALDYDGTPTALASDPRETLLAVNIQTLVRRLRHYVPVAVLSGRHRPELATLLAGVEVDFMIGNHGLDWGDPTHPELQRVQGLVNGWLEQLQVSLLPTVAPSGWSRRWSGGGLICRGVGRGQAVHRLCTTATQPIPIRRWRSLTRHCPICSRPRRSAAANGWLTCFPMPRPARAAPVAANGGTELGRAIFFGDDDTDEDVFRLEHPAILGVRVGYSPASHARFYLRRQQDMSKALAYSWLACGGHLLTDGRSNPAEIVKFLCMFEVCRFSQNVVARFPWIHDPVKELAAPCSGL
ncbi:MAG: hypothetical protein IPL99_14470 [Candidatus Competibacteraceae bacterium]|nr:hypothetical protein [Candidatus Competibacteraceae bacterium]